MRNDILLTIIGKVADKVSDNAVTIAAGVMFALGVFTNLMLWP